MLIKLRKYKFAQRFSRGSSSAHIQSMADTLVLIHVLFRHGDRTPEKGSLYPTDPNKDYDYSPFGYGQLINVGKARAYRLGENLRERYGHIVDEIYTPRILDAWTSDFDRTKMTLQLALAGLFPPKKEQIWNAAMPWQPIPFNFTPKFDDKMLLAFYLSEPALKAYYDYVNGPGKEVMKSYADLIDYVEKNSGFSIKNPRDMFCLSCTLNAQKNIGLELPEWTTEVWPDKMEEFAMKEFDFVTGTKELQSLTVGNLLQKIVNDSLMKIRGKSGYQLHLYSGHDFTVGMMLRLLNLFDGRHPDYCANVALELHNIDGIYGFKIKYQCHEEEKPKFLQIPNYGEFWPLDEFIAEYKDLLINVVQNDDQ